MRMSAMITVDLLDEDGFRTGISSNGFTFWRAYYELSRRGRGEGEFRDDGEDFNRRYVFQMENALRLGFPIALGDQISRHFYRGRFYSELQTNVIVLLRSIDYGSLVLGVDLIVPAITALGITSDDLIDLLTQYTPSAMGSALPGAVPGMEAKVSGRVTEADALPPPEPPSTATSPSPAAIQPAAAPGRVVDKVWMIANTSLVIPAVILLAASFVMFQSVGEERSRLTAALLQERTDIAAQREKMLDRYSDQLRAFKEHLISQSKHYTDLDEIEASLLKERLRQIKSLPEKDSPLRTDAR